TSPAAWRCPGCSQPVSPLRYCASPASGCLGYFAMKSVKSSTACPCSRDRNVASAALYSCSGLPARDTAGVVGAGCAGGAAPGGTDSDGTACGTSGTGATACAGGAAGEGTAGTRGRSTSAISDEGGGGGVGFGGVGFGRAGVGRAGAAGACVSASTRVRVSPTAVSTESTRWWTR